MYASEFYRTMDRQTTHAARVILRIVKDILPKTDSAVDVGCGVGTWLRVLSEEGLGDLLGIDGAWVDKSLLQIPTERFREHDLRQPVQCDRRFDLAISCEVGEHLPESAAEGYVDSLCRLSDFVLFSAAIPLQGGVNHINEQWPTYWTSKFEERGYTPIDFIRKRIWSDRGIPWHYRQNVLLFVNAVRVCDLRLRFELIDTLPPEKYLLTYTRLTSPGIRQSLSALRQSIKRRFKSSESHGLLPGNTDNP